MNTSTSATLSGSVTNPRGCLLVDETVPTLAPIRRQATVEQIGEERLECLLVRPQAPRQPVLQLEVHLVVQVAEVRFEKHCVYPLAR
jgi:hypothetical protein